MYPDGIKELTQWYAEQRSKLIRGMCVGAVMTLIGLLALTLIFIVS